MIRFVAIRPDVEWLGIGDERNEVIAGAAGRQADRLTEDISEGIDDALYVEGNRRSGIFSWGIGTEMDHVGDRALAAKPGELYIVDGEIGR